MRTMLAVSAGVMLLLTAPRAGRAENRAGGTQSAGGVEPSKDKPTGRSKDDVPASLNKTFQWEEKVVGPKDKAIDRDRIAAMQQQGRREAAAKRREPAKKPTRGERVKNPAWAVIPTQDIEKPAAPGSARSHGHASSTSPKQHDAVDDLLAENSASDDPSSHARSAKSHGAAKHGGHAQRSRH